MFMHLRQKAVQNIEVYSNKIAHMSRMWDTKNCKNHHNH